MAYSDRRGFLRFLVAVGLAPFMPRGRSRSSTGGFFAVDAAGALTDWARGGTAAMTAKATYPDPFSDPLDSCALVAATTQGPCTTEADLVREDVSEGWTGLPVRLALRVVDTNCAPVAGATVKIWHTNLEGSYSGQTPNNGMCLLQQSYASANFFRGVQTTGSDGVVYFDTCFPGWYRGRAIHIHFQVASAGATYRTSQLFVPEDVTADIFANHPEYAGYGQPDTSFAADNIVAAIPSGERERLILAVARMSDGAMLASKTVTVVAGTAGPTATATTDSTDVPTPTPTGTAVASNCAGDCDGSDDVTVDELVRGVNIALGDAQVSACRALDRDGNGSVTIDELLAAVDATLNGCA